MSTSLSRDELDAFRADFDALRHEIQKVIVGQADLIDGVLTALLAGGHVLVEGQPGTAKTLLARTLAQVVDVGFQRIQCTPDLMPADVIGTYVIMETPQGRRSFEFQKGPLFSNVVLIDQINRTTPKTQSAFLEAMDEEAITVSTESFTLPSPYFVIATQNTSEMEGAYPLAEAEIDRFMLKLVVPTPNVDEMEQVLQRTTDSTSVGMKKIVDGRRILQMRQLVQQLAVAPDVRRMAVSLVAATQPDSSNAPDVVKRFVHRGSSVRGAQAMVLAAKVGTIVSERAEVSTEDLQSAARAAMRHRLILNFDGQAENVNTDDLIDAVLKTVTR